nr:minor head protein [uncultured Mediterranean phage uvMED]
MNTRQLALFLRHAFSLTNATDAAVKGANPEFASAMQQIRRLVEGMPEEALMQAKAWKELEPQVMQALRPYNDSFRASIVENLEGLAPEIEENVIKSLEAVNAPLPVGTTGPIKGAPFGGLQAFGNQQLASNVQSALSRTSIADVSLEKLFRINPEVDTPTSLWMKQNYKTIDRTVRTGILQGASTENIAAQISEEITKNGLLRATKDTDTGKIKAQANTIARTAVQSFNRQITEEVWDANDDALGGLLYEWTSALDSRVCPTCGPLDGQKKPKRSDLPSTPIHPNCRCNVVLVDPDDDDDVRTAIQLSETKPTGKGAYASKVKVNGKLFYRQAVEVKKKGATYADYLADMAKKDTKSSRLTLAEYFGGAGKAGQGESTLGVERADWFTKAVKKGMRPDDALVRLVTRPNEVTKLRTFKTDWNRDIDPPKPPAPKRKPKPKPPGPSPAAVAKAKAEKAAKAKAAAQAKAAAKAQAAKEAKAKQVAAAKAKAEAAAAAKAKKAAELAKQKAKAEAAAKKAAKAKAKTKPAPVTPKQAETKRATSNRKTSDTNYDYDKNWEKLGYDKKSQYRKVKEDVVEWSGKEFEGVRAAQFADARDRGVELNNYERLQTRRLEKGEQRSQGNRARRLEDFIDRAPKYDGTIRRGIAMDTREDVMNTIERYSSGKKNLAIESWTTDPGVSYRFAMGNGDPRPQRMSILVEGQTRGAPINAISGFDDEYEILVPSGVRYEVVDVKEKFVKGKPGGGPATKMDHTDWTVTLREVKD